MLSPEIVNNLLAACGPLILFPLILLGLPAYIAFRTSTEIMIDSDLRKRVRTFFSMDLTKRDLSESKVDLYYWEYRIFHIAFVYFGTFTAAWVIFLSTLVTEYYDFGRMFVNGVSNISKRVIVRVRNLLRATSVTFR